MAVEIEIGDRDDGRQVAHRQPRGLEIGARQDRDLVEARVHGHQIAEPVAVEVRGLQIRDPQLRGHRPRRLESAVALAVKHADLPAQHSSAAGPIRHPVAVEIAPGEPARCPLVGHVRREEHELAARVEVAERRHADLAHVGEAAGHRRHRRGTAAQLHAAALRRGRGHHLALVGRNAVETEETAAVRRPFATQVGGHRGAFHRRARHVGHRADHRGLRRRHHLYLHRLGVRTVAGEVEDVRPDGEHRGRGRSR